MSRAGKLTAAQVRLLARVEAVERECANPAGVMVKRTEFATAYVLRRLALIRHDLTTHSAWMTDAGRAALANHTAEKDETR